MLPHCVDALTLFLSLLHHCCYDAGAGDENADGSANAAARGARVGRAGPAEDDLSPAVTATVDKLRIKAAARDAKMAEAKAAREAAKASRAAVAAAAAASAASTSAPAGTRTSSSSVSGGGGGGAGDDTLSILTSGADVDNDDSASGPHGGGGGRISVHSFDSGSGQPQQRGVGTLSAICSDTIDTAAAAAQQLQLTRSPAAAAAAAGRARGAAGARSSAPIVGGSSGVGLLQALEGMKWEITAVDDVYRVLCSDRWPWRDHAAAIKTIYSLAKGDWPFQLCKPVQGVPAHIPLRLFEARINDHARVLWELAVDFSERLNRLGRSGGAPSSFATGGTGSGSGGPTSTSGGGAARASPQYTQMVRVWAVIYQHDDIDGAVARVVRKVIAAHNAGNQAIFSVKLNATSSVPAVVPLLPLRNAPAGESAAGVEPESPYVWNGKVVRLLQQSPSASTAAASSSSASVAAAAAAAAAASSSGDGGIGSTPFSSIVSAAAEKRGVPIPTPGQLAYIKPTASAPGQIMKFYSITQLLNAVVLVHSQMAVIASPQQGSNNGDGAQSVVVAAAATAVAPAADGWLPPWEEPATAPAATAVAASGGDAPAASAGTGAVAASAAAPPLLPIAEAADELSDDDEYDEGSANPSSSGAAGGAVNTSPGDDGDDDGGVPELPFRVSPLEFSYINVTSPSALVVLGRSGSGKTTVLMFRMWNVFFEYWKSGSGADASSQLQLGTTSTSAAAAAQLQLGARKPPSMPACAPMLLRPMRDRWMRNGDLVRAARDKFEKAARPTDGSGGYLSVLIADAEAVAREAASNPSTLSLSSSLSSSTAWSSRGHRFNASTSTAAAIDIHARRRQQQRAGAGTMGTLAEKDEGGDGDTRSGSSEGSGSITGSDDDRQGGAVAEPDETTPDEKGGAEGSSALSSRAPLTHMHQVFVTRSKVLRDEVLKHFRGLQAAGSTPSHAVISESAPPSMAGVALDEYPFPVNPEDPLSRKPHVPLALIEDRLVAPIVEAAAAAAAAAVEAEIVRQGGRRGSGRGGRSSSSAASGALEQYYDDGSAPLADTIPDADWPLFVTTREWLEMLDNTLPGGSFFVSALKSAPDSAAAANGSGGATGGKRGGGAGSTKRGGRSSAAAGGGSGAAEAAEEDGANFNLGFGEAYEEEDDGGGLSLIASDNLTVQGTELTRPTAAGTALGNAAAASPAAAAVRRGNAVLDRAPPTSTSDDNMSTAGSLSSSASRALVGRAQPAAPAKSSSQRGTGKGKGSRKALSAYPGGEVFFPIFAKMWGQLKSAAAGAAKLAAAQSGSIAVASNTTVEALKLSPALVWQEIRSFIKGSAEALDSPGGHLSRDDYLRLGKKRSELNEVQVRA